MSVESWLRRAGAYLGIAGASAAAPVREAAGATIDADEDLWRPLTGDASRDLTPLTIKRMQDMALHVWETNLLANRLIELPLAYLLAEGVTLRVKDPEAQGWLDAFWRDPINDMDMKLEKKARELALFGEQCWPVFVNEVSGHVRLGYLDPCAIATVVQDPDNAEQPIGVVTKKDKKGKDKHYRVIVNGPEAVFTERTREIRAGFRDGECFFFKVNDLSNGRRGRSDLLAQIDWVDGYDSYLFGELERANHLRAFIWDVLLQGATPEEVAQRARKFTAPSPGSVRVHNEAEVWSAISPSLQAADGAATARLFRNHTLGGGTIPEHWYGGGGDVNRATAGEMGEPTFKVLSMRQRKWKHILEFVGTFVIMRRLDPSGGSAFDPSDPDPDLAVEASFPEMTARDTTKYAAALGQVVVACTQAIDAGLVTEQTAVKVLLAVAGRLGIEFDAEAELAAAKEEAGARAEADVFTEPPAAGAPADG